MIWRNPWAWLGLATIALPIAIHLYSRGHARVHRFPTLRFLDASRLLPTRRTRLSDRTLLAVRVAILLVAVASLAQPLFLTSRRASARNASLARAVVLDTSVDVLPGGRAPLDSVIGANHLATDATIATLITTGDPRTALPGAVAWLDAQGTRGEIAIVSRFQLGALDSVDIDAIPARFGIRLVQVPAPVASVAIRTRAGPDEVAAHVATSGDMTDVEWSAQPATRWATTTILASAAERVRAEAARAAAMTIPVALPLDSFSPIGVVEPAFEGRANLLAGSIKPRRPWMVDLVASVATDSLLIEAARHATAVAVLDDTNLVVVARTDGGRPIVLAAENTVEGRERLLLFSLADAGSLTSAALFAAISHAMSLAPPARWFEPSTIPDAELAQWQRSPADSPTRRTPADASDDGESDGRWLWLGVLGLLAIETWLRRERRMITANQATARDRAA